MFAPSIKRVVFLLAATGILLSLESRLHATDQPPAGSFLLDLPAQCRFGETCWVANYVDADSGPEAKDFRCGPRTYNGHDGVDLAIKDLHVMAQGVPVVEVAPGTIRRLRDGVADVGLSNEASAETVAGRECGNGVVIDHGNGWETQYCHMKHNSLQVKAGQRVERGSRLGLIGLSGKTEFPHVHLTVRHDGHVIDPFTGGTQDVACGTPGRALWRDPAVGYEEVALYNVGFAASEPFVDAIRQGQPSEVAMPLDAPALVLWVDLFGVQEQDVLEFRITGPDGQLVLDRGLQLDRTQARHFAYAGLRRPRTGWAAGLYNGDVTFRRGQGATEVRRTRHVTVQFS